LRCESTQAVDDCGREKKFTDLYSKNFISLEFVPQNE
jgi:hypothetical protein